MHYGFFMSAIVVYLNSLQPCFQLVTFLEPLLHFPISSSFFLTSRLLSITFFNFAVLALFLLIFTSICFHQFQHWLSVSHFVVTISVSFLYYVSLIYYQFALYIFYVAFVISERLKCVLDFYLYDDFVMMCFPSENSLLSCNFIIKFESTT